MDNLFGQTPWEVQQGMNQQINQSADAYAKLDPFQRAAAGMHRAGGMLAGPVAGMLGMENPAIAQSKRTEQIMGAQGTDLSSSEGLLKKAEQFRQAGDLRTATALAMKGQEMRRQEAAAALAGRKQDDTERRTESLTELQIAQAKKALRENPNLTVTEVGVKGKPGWMQKVLFDKTKPDSPYQELGDPYQTAASMKISLGGTGGGLYDLSPAQQAALDTAMTEGRLDPARLNSRSAKLLANQFILNPALDMVSGSSDAKERGATQTKVGTQIAVLRPFIKMVDLNGDALNQLADNAVKTDSRLANKTLNWISQNMGDNPDTAELLAQVKIFKDEAARVVSNPNLVGVLSDTARKEMEAVISGDMPLNSMKRVINRLKLDSHNRIRTLEEEHDRIKKKTPAAPVAPPVPLVNQIPNGAPSNAISLEQYLGGQ